MSSNLITPVRVESTGGLAAWFRHIAATVSGWPAAYRTRVPSSGRAARSC